mmetsp:Transcript_130752/g.279664  ORF Transcript_130752/g.279664 Transcript_130752/m.279664 type:complete len:332 (+) Transcript_130752:68-1063(+)
MGRTALLIWGALWATAGLTRSSALATLRVPGEAPELGTAPSRDQGAGQGPHDPVAAAPLPKSAVQRKRSLLAVVSRVQEVLHERLPPLRFAAVLTTVALQLSPLRSCLEIRRRGDVQRYDGYPYFTVLAGAVQWCVYAAAATAATGDTTFLTMVEANGPGVLCGTFYVVVFLCCVKPGDARGAALRGYLFGGAALLFAEAIALVVLRGRAVLGLGLLGAIGSAQIALSPFKTLPEVLRTRSTRSWPVDLCLWSFIQSLATGSFGLAIDDAWILVPNLIGVIAAGVQLALIATLSEGSRSSSSGCAAAISAAATAPVALSRYGATLDGSSLK